MSNNNREVSNKPDIHTDVNPAPKLIQFNLSEDDLPECAVCKEFMTGPVISDRCSHSICQFCWKKLPSNTCPSCRAQNISYKSNLDYDKLLQTIFHDKYKAQWDAHIEEFPELWTLEKWRQKFKNLTYCEFLARNKVALLKYLHKIYTFISEPEQSEKTLSKIFYPYKMLVSFYYHHQQNFTPTVLVSNIHAQSRLHAQISFDNYCFIFFW